MNRVSAIAGCARIVGMRPRPISRNVSPCKRWRDPESAIEDVAWLRGVEDELRLQGQAAGQSLNIRRREIAYDRGLFWGGTWREFPEQNSGGLFIEIVTSIRQKAWTIAIKVGSAELRRVFDFARSRDAPGDGWHRGQRRLRQNTAAVWLYPCTHRRPSEVAAVAIRGAHWISGLPER